METFQQNIIRGVFQTFITLFVLNFFYVGLAYFREKSPDTTTIFVINSFALLYLALNKYIISISVNSIRKEVSITQFWIIRKTKYIIPFEKLGYTYKIETIGRGYKGKTLRLHFDNNIIKIQINKFGWNAKSLDTVVHSLEKNKITKLNLYKSLKDASAYE
jgi:hypothetical protein